MVSLWLVYGYGRVSYGYCSSTLRAVPKIWQVNTHTWPEAEAKPKAESRTRTRTRTRTRSRSRSQTHLDSRHVADGK